MIWFQLSSQVRTAYLLRLSQPFTCVYAVGTKFGTNQTSTDTFKHSLSYISIGIFSSIYLNFPFIIPT